MDKKYLKDMVSGFVTTLYCINNKNLKEKEVKRRIDFMLSSRKGREQIRDMLIRYSKMPKFADKRLEINNAIDYLDLL